MLMINHKNEEIQMKQRQTLPRNSRGLWLGSRLACYKWVPPNILRYEHTYRNTVRKKKACH